MADDPLTPSSPLGDAERITPPSAASQPEAATPQTAVAPDVRPAVSMLYIQGDPSEQVTRFVDQFFGYNPDLTAKGATRVFANSWDEFTQALQQYSSIGRLVILMHSTTDSVEMGSEWMLTSEMLADLAAAGNLPVVKEVIEIEGCMIGRVPSYLITLAKILKAPRLDAFSYWHYIGQIKILPKPDTPASGEEYDEYVAALSNAVWDVEVYLPDGAPSASLVAEAVAPQTVGATGQTYYLMYEWFQEDFKVGDSPPIDGDRDVMESPSPSSREREYVPRDSATVANISTEQDAQAFVNELASSPVSRLYRIVVRPVY